MHGSLAAGLALAVCLTACSMGKDVHDAKEASDRIENVTKKLSDKTSDIKSSARKDLTVERSVERYHDVEKADFDGERLTMATIFACSFEFQQWTGEFGDSVEKEMNFRDDALRMFFPMIAEPRINHQYDIRGMPELPNGHNWKILASIAATMDEVDRDQKAAAVANNIEPVSLYSLIVDQLSYVAARSRGEKIPDLAYRVLDYQDEAITLLQYRHNYLAAMLLSRFTTFATDIFRETLSLFFDVSLDTGDPNGVEIAKIEDQGLGWIKKINQTRKDLHDLGCKVDMNPYIGRSFLNAKFSQAPGAAHLAFENKTIKQFADAFKDLQNQYAEEPASDFTDTDPLIRNRSRHSVRCQFQAGRLAYSHSKSP